MAISREALEAELRRRGVSPPGTAPAQAPLSRSAVEDELRRRGALPRTASAAAPAGQEPGFFDYVPLANIPADIADIATEGFNSPSIQARRERREEAARQLLPYAASALGGAAGASLRGLGLVGRAFGAGAGSAVGDAAGQAVTQGGQVDPRQTAVAAVGGAIGQPVGEAIGAALPAAGRLLFRGGETGRQGVQSAIDDAARLGEVPTVAQATQSSFLDGMESLLSRTPGGAGRIRNRVRETTETVRAGIERIARQGTSRDLDAESAGRAVLGGVDDFVNRFQARSGPLFDAVTDRVGRDTPAALHNTITILQRLVAPVAGAERVGERFANPFLRGLADDVLADVGNRGQMPFHAVQRMRTLVGERLNNPSLTSDVPSAQLRQLYGAISDDIRTAAINAGPEAAQAFTRANRFYRAGSQRIETTLEPLTRSRTPEKVFQSLMSGGRSGGTQIRTVMRSLSPAQQDIVTGTAIRRLGTAVPSQQGAEGAEFSFNTFLTRWNQLDDNARSALFNRGRNAQLGLDLNSLARYAERVRESSKAFANPSGTSGATLGGTLGLLSAGSVASAPVLGTGALALPMIFGTGAGMANLSARLMTSPRFVRWLAQSTRVNPAGIPAHVARLNIVVRKEDPETQEAVLDYLQLLDAPGGAGG